MRVLTVSFLVLVSAFLLGCDSADAEIPALQERLRQNIQLKTVEYVYRSIIYHESNERLWGIFPLQQDILFGANIVITAGMRLSDDFELFRDGNDPSRLFVVLPAPVILSSDLDESSIYQYYIHQNSRRLDMAEVGESIYSIKENAIETAITSGILERAEQNAKKEITSLLNLLGFPNVTFTTQEEKTIRG